MKRLLISLASATLCASAAAEGIDFKLSGFGTIGGTNASTDEPEYRANLREQKGAGKGVDFGIDSMLAVQGNLRFNDTFSAVGQVLSARRLGASGTPEVEWLYGQADLPSGFKVRAGRMVLPIFMISDSPRRQLHPALAARAG